MPILSEVKKARVPIKIWSPIGQVESQALDQLANIANLPFVFHHVAAMPDVHLGIGATVGSVIATKGAICPAAVGVDIGCVSGDTEYLGEYGWKRICDYPPGERLWEYDAETRVAHLSLPTNFIVKECATLLHFHTKYGIDQVLSEDHRVFGYRLVGRERKRQQVVVTAKQLRDEHERLKLGAKFIFETTFTPDIKTQLGLSAEAIRVQVMTNADAYMDGKKAVAKFRKQRKIDRARILLEKAGITFTERRSEREGVTRFRFAPPRPLRGFDGEWWRASLRELEVIADEVFRWDGHENVFFTRKKRDADFIQYAISATGRRAVLRLDGSDFRVFAHDAKSVGLAGSPRSIIREVAAPGGVAYCFSTRTGFWIMRHGGNVAITGNCGMAAVQTNLTSHDFGDGMTAKIRSSIERGVPVGNGPGGASAEPSSGASSWLRRAGAEMSAKVNSTQLRQLGTLGGGNHFIELCYDTTDRVWIMLHSGSRNLGKCLAEVHMKHAKEIAKAAQVHLADPNLAYLVDGTDDFAAYVADVEFAQEYAFENRRLMLAEIIRDLRNFFPHLVLETPINCHHNYLSRETHFGEKVIVTRKGAIRAGLGDLGIIPGSMGTRSYIVKGLGNPDSFESCSHGAGRRMSRGAAKRTFTLDDLARQTEGVECRKDAGVLDEIPGAYKDIDEVMANQSDLVEIVHALKQFMCVKG